MQASNIGCLKGSLYLHVYENNIYPQLAGAFVQLCCLKASLHVTLRLSRVSAFDIQNFALSGLQKTCRIAAMRQESRRSVRCRCDMLRRSRQSSFSFWSVLYLKVSVGRILCPVWRFHT